MSDSYVLLTGSRNNAGDFLIKYRAKQLFAEFRKDRAIKDVDSWKEISPEDLEMINDSKALILTGGPALRPNIYGGIYPLVPDLNQIKVPILTMGVGWKNKFGNWENTKSIKFDAKSKSLLGRVNDTGYQSSVRDFHSLNVCQQNGWTNFTMTGCPALYDTAFIGKGFKSISEFKEISYSLGVSFVKHPEHAVAMKQDIKMLRDLFPKAKVTVVFHHSLDAKNFSADYGSSKFATKHQELLNWVKQEELNYIDISGSEQHLINHYKACDLHVGYRVHAHIFMSSISKPSILLSEDGRGKALMNVIGGLILVGGEYVETIYPEIKSSRGFRLKTKQKILARFFPERMGIKTKFRMATETALDLKNNIEYELDHNFQRLLRTRENIDANFVQMKSFLKQLP